MVERRGTSGHRQSGAAVNDGGTPSDENYTYHVLVEDGEVHYT